MYTHTHEIAVGAAGVEWRGIQTDCTAIESISVSSADVWNLPNEEDEVQTFLQEHTDSNVGGEA